jgi:hypothetical protein
MAVRTIALKGYQYAQVKEGKVKTGTTIRPGHLVDREAADVMKPVATAAAAAIVPMVAMENELIGKGVDTAYAALDRVYVWVPLRGAEGYLRLAAAAAAVAYGALLETQNDGTVKVRTTGQAIARALEAVDNSAGGSEVFIHVEFL